LLREILRLSSLKSGWDVVFVARVVAANADYNTLKESVVSLLSRACLLAKENEEVSLSVD
jgi:ribonuclease P protein component